MKNRKIKKHRKSTQSTLSAFNKIILIAILSTTITKAQGKFFGGNGSGYSTNNINAICSGQAKTWDGIDWSPLGIPTTTNPVIINGNYDTSVNGNIDKCVSEITQNGLLEIRAGNYINVQNHIINEGIIDVFNQGSVVQLNNDAVNTGTGTYNTQISTTELDDENRFTYFSSPSITETLNTFSAWANTNAMWQFNNTTQFWESVNTTTTMLAGKGFAIKGDSNATYPITPTTNFNGAFTNGIVIQNIQMNVGQQEPDATGDDSNFLGNPYPSAINADLFLNENTNIDALYFWTHASALPTNGDNLPISDYAVWTLGAGTLGKTVNIASGQGFFVTANTNGTATFNNLMRVTTGNNDFKNTENRDRLWLNLTNVETDNFNQIAIVFIEQGTDNFDHQYDALNLTNNNATSFYSLGINQEKLVIQAKSLLLSDQEIIPLGISINQQGSFKISIDHLENLENVQVYLKDKDLNRLTNLNKSAYYFNVTENGTNNNRFEIVLNRSSLFIDNQIVINENLIVINVDKELFKVKTNNGSLMTNLKVYDVLGKAIIRKKCNSNELVLKKNKQSEVLFIKVQLENGQVLHKKFLSF